MAAESERTVTDERFDRVDTRGQLWYALRELTPRQRAVLVLRYYENHTDTEIASQLGISRSTVRSTASRALDRLRTNWTARRDSPLSPPTNTDADPTLRRTR